MRSESSPAGRAWPFDAPHDLAVALSYLGELSAPVAPSELAAMLVADGVDDRDLAVEQCLLAAVVAEVTDAAPDARLAAAADTVCTHGALFLAELGAAAGECLNRLLNSPHAALWQGHPDGGIALRRHVRVLRARLHRACSR